MGKLQSDFSVRSFNHLNRKPGDYSDSRTYRALVVRVYYADDPLNLTRNAQNPQVLYDVLLLGGPREGQILTNVRAMGAVGGQYTFEEVIYRATSKAFSGANRVPMQQQDGDFVYVTLGSGVKTAPIIMGAADHPLETANPPANAADGPRRVSGYNGVVHLTDRQGVHSITRNGGVLDSGGYFIPNPRTTIEAQVKLYQNALALSAGQGAVVQTLDGAAQTLTITMKSGLTITVNGAQDAVTVQTTGGAKLIVDGKNDVVRAQDKSGGALKISGGKVGLGAPSLELVDALSQTLNLLSTDLGNLGYVLANSGQYAALKAKVDAIKGGI